VTDDRLRVAIVGTGAIAEQHVDAIRGLEGDLVLVAAADIDTSRVTAFAERHAIPGRYGALDELLESERPDLVHVCTPPTAHAALVIRCLRAGACVFCEKPPTVSLAELDEVERAEHETGRSSSFVCQMRFGSGAQHLRRLIDTGSLGRPLVAVAHTTWFRDAAYYDVPWRGRWESEAGGPTIGHGIHTVDLMLWLLGEWREVRAKIGRVDRDIETEDVSLAIVEFESGALGSVVTSVVSPREETYLRFDFQRATVELRHLYAYTDADWRFTPAPGAGEAVREEWERFPAARPSSQGSQLREIVAALRRGDRLPAGPAEVRPTMEFITAVYRSAMTGLPVERSALTDADRFYRVLHGDVAGWAPALSGRAP
jgi:predicted dehydrogenase